MNAERVPAVMAATYQETRERQERLRDEARDERLARAARAPRAASRRLTNRLGMGVPLAGVGPMEGTE